MTISKLHATFQLFTTQAFVQLIAMALGASLQEASIMTSLFVVVAWLSMPKFRALTQQSIVELTGRR